VGVESYENQKPVLLGPLLRREPTLQTPWGLPVHFHWLNQDVPGQQAHRNQGDQKTISAPYSSPSRPSPGAPGTAIGKRTGREGTTVEMACL